MKYLILYLFFAIAISCHSDEKNVYLYYPKNSKLTEVVLINANQIIFNNDFIIVLVDICKQWDDSYFHLLFYDQNYLLKYASYSPSGYIDSIVNKKISGMYSKKRIEDQKFFINNLPPGYNFTFKKYAYPNYEGRVIYTVIDKFELNKNSNQASLYVHRSTDKYAGLNHFRVQADTSYYSKLNIIDTLYYTLPELHFNFKEMEVFITYIDSSNRYIHDFMIFRNQQVIESFFDQILIPLPVAKY